jgi:hypothetical protein
MKTAVVTVLALCLAPIAYTQSADEGLLFHLTFDKADNLGADSSGNGNNARVAGDVESVEGVLGGAIAFDDEASYLELPQSESLKAPLETMTLSIWIKPDDEKDYSDFFTQGDWNVLKLQDPETLNFFIGGWRRGELQAGVPENWDGNWHHVVGVADTDELFLYVDGELLGSLIVPAGVEATDFPWNIRA